MTPSPIRRNAPLATVLAALTACLFAVTLVSPPAAPAAWTVKGGGFGHGVGMGVYGAYGMAKEGYSYKRITKKYYKGTKVTKLRTARKVRVLLNIDPGTVRFSGVKRACGLDLTESRSYGAKLNGRRIVLIRSNGKRLANCGRKLKSENDGRVVFKGLGRYRGGIEIVPTENPRGSLNVINAVSINDYVKGVIPNESIPSWPMEMLRVQAVISRSFALAAGVGGNGFDLYNDTRSQVYKDISSEYKRTNRAAAQTASEVVSYKGMPALTMFSASSGGWTESIENVFFGEPVPYLTGVKDPWDKKTSPYHRWSYDFSNSTIASALGVKGRLKRVEITKRGDSPRVMWARFYGTGGVTKVRGDTIQYNLGLPDRLIFSIKKSRARASASSKPRRMPGSSGYPLLTPNEG